MTAVSPVTKIARRTASSAPLSFAQEGLWLLAAADPAAVAYNIPLLVPWGAPLDVPTLRAALGAVARRHDILRTSYPMCDGVPCQVVGAPDQVEVDVINVAGVADAAGRARREAQAKATEPFELTEEPPLRCAVWQGIPGGDLLLLCLHHIAVDGWSLSLLLEELETTYQAIMLGIAPDLAEVSLQYSDFAAWEREFFGTEHGRQLIAARVAQLRGYPVELRLGVPRPASVAEGPRARVGDQCSFEIPADLGNQVRRRARDLRVTPYMVMVAAFCEIIRRWSGRSQFLLGTVMVNRPVPELERTCGHFTTIAPLRCNARPSFTFAEFCGAIRAEFATIMRGPAIPFDQIVQGLAPTRVGRIPLIQIGFAVLHTAAQADGRQRRASLLALPTGTAAIDLNLLVESGTEEFACTVEYDVNQYSHTVVAQVRDAFLTLLDAAVADPGAALARLPLPRRGDGLPDGVLVGDRIDLVADHHARMAAAPKEGYG